MRKLSFACLVVVTFGSFLVGHVEKSPCLYNPLVPYLTHWIQEVSKLIEDQEEQDDNEPEKEEDKKGKQSSIKVSER